MRIRSTFRGVALGLVLLFAACSGTNGCATAGVQRQGFTALSTAESVLEGAQTLEIASVCGRPTALPPPECVPIDLHHQLQGYLLEAASYGQDVTAIMRALPARSTTPGNVVDLIAKVYALLQRVLSALPHSHQVDALQAQLVGK